jgi:hypothetical protein
VLKTEEAAGDWRKSSYCVLIINLYSGDQIKENEMGVGEMRNTL